MNQEGGTKNEGGATLVHVFIDGRKYEFSSSSTTGAALKAAAGARPIDGLYQKVQGRLVEIGNDQVIELKDGDHFSIVPDGTVS